MRAKEFLLEGVIPSSKPVGYQITASGNEVLTSFQIGNKFVEVGYNIGATAVSPYFLPLINPKFISSDGKSVMAGDLAFTVGDDVDSMTDQKNQGAPVPEARKILSAVAYAADDMVYSKRSLLPFITFWARPGENRDTIYERLAQAFTVSWRTRGYVRLNPDAVYGRESPYGTWIWARADVFNNRTADREKIEKFLYR